MISDTLAVDLAQARAAADSLMTETVTIGVESYATDTVSGDAVRTVESPVYQGKARLKFSSLVVFERNTQGQQVATSDVVLKLPPTSSGVDSGHVVRVTASTSDGTLVGRWFRVKALPQGGQVTAHRYPVEEVT